MREKERRLEGRDLLLVGFTLFSMFFGAGNLIFPPNIAAQAGTQTWPAMLDNTLEFLMMAGMDLPLAVMACIPEPWRNDCTLSRSRRDLYHYYATLMEPWDGPAAILFSDGDVVGAVLDRNGLRPARYYLTDDSRLIL